MHTIHHPPRIFAGALALVLALLCLVAGPPLNATIIITDSFNGSGPLNGDTVQYSSSGSYSWVAQGPDSGGYYSSGGVVLEGPAGVDLSAPTTRMAWVNRTLGATERAVYSLDVSLTSNGSPVAWSSISFLTNPGSTYDSAEWNTGQLTLRLGNTGTWSVLGAHYGFNSQDTITSGALAPGFVTGGYNNLKLDYDNASNLLSAYINDVQVLAPVNPFAVTGVYPDNPTYEPTITAAGFHTYGGITYGSSVDNFSLTIDPVPEPGCTMLTLAGGAVLLIFRRRQRVAIQ